jgi:hypothetical protein
LRRYADEKSRLLLAARNGGGEVAGVLCGEISQDWFSGRQSGFAMAHCAPQRGETPLAALAGRFVEWATARDAGDVYIALAPGAGGDGLTALGFAPGLRVLRRRLREAKDYHPDTLSRTIRIIGDVPPQIQEQRPILTLAQYRPDLLPPDKSAAKEKDGKNGESKPSDEGEPTVRRLTADDIGAIIPFALAARKEASRLPFVRRGLEAQIAAHHSRPDCRWLAAQSDGGEIIGVLGGITRPHPFYRGRLACALLLRANTANASAALARGFLRWAKRSKAGEAVFVLPEDAATERLRRRMGLISAGKTLWRAI